MNPAICPYCGKPLVQGYMQSPRPISWLPKKLKRFTNTGFLENGAVVLSQGKPLAAPCAIAYHCAACKKVILDYADNACDYYADKT